MTPQELHSIGGGPGKLKDIGDILRDEGYGVVEGMDEVLKKMEEMAGDKSEHGKRQPGEKCRYEMSWED
jgi:hypothetical protein